MSDMSVPLFLGIDPGARKLGYALITADRRIVDAGIILQPRDKTQDLREQNYERIQTLFRFFDQLMRDHPSIITLSMERVFFAHANQNNAEFVYGVRGMLIALAGQYDFPIIDVTPTELKRLITRSGRANKIRMQQTIRALFGLDQTPEYDDAADALGLAWRGVTVSGKGEVINGKGTV